MVNPHIYAANTSLYDHKERDAGYRIAQATLALAYEQRTANLIAWRLAEKNRLNEGPEIDELIRERLEIK